MTPPECLAAVLTANLAGRSRALGVDQLVISRD